MNRFVAFTFLPFLAASVACGSLASDKDPVLATVHGELTNPQSLDTPLDTRVAVVWLGFAHGYSLAEDLQVQPVFPSQFKLELTHVPPADAMVNKANLKAKNDQATPPSPPPDGDPSAPTPAPSGGSGGTGGVGGTGGPSGRAGAGAGVATSGSVHAADMSPSTWANDFGFAVGSVVAYQDLNHNGKLDLVDEGATAYVDRILGANPSTILVYFEGTIPADFADEDGKLPQRGYNLFHIADCSVSATTGAARSDGTGQDLGDSSASCNDKTQWLPIETLYTLPLTGDPKFSDIMCKNGGSFSVGETSGSGGGGEATGNSSSPPPSGGSSGGGGSTGGFGGTDGGLGDPDASVPGPTYPAANDPLLQCAPDGRSFTYDCKPQTPKLCGDTVSVSCGSLPLPDGPIPANWPCPVH